MIISRTNLQIVQIAPTYPIQIKLITCNIVESLLCRLHLLISSTRFQEVVQNYENTRFFSICRRKRVSSIHLIQVIQVVEESACPYHMPVQLSKFHETHWSRSYPFVIRPNRTLPRPSILSTTSLPLIKDSAARAINTFRDKSKFP